MFQGFRNQMRGSNFGAGFEAGVADAFGFSREAAWKNGRRTYNKGGFLGKTLPSSTAKEISTKKWARVGGIASLAFMGYSAYSGFQEGGVFGAAKNVVRDAAIQGIARGAFNAVVGAGLAVPTLVGVAAVGAAYGGYRLGEAGQHYAKSLRRLEMGTDIVDTFGTISTMRQRSLNAIQNSRVNGRMALGNEASLMHMPYRS